MKFMLETDDHPEPELMGLAVNLALYPINAQIMCQGPGLKLLMNKALHLRDSLMMKLIRNISKHEGEIKNLFLVTNLRLFFFFDFLIFQKALKIFLNVFWLDAVQYAETNISKIM